MQKVPVSRDYDQVSWRRDLGILIKSLTDPKVSGQRGQDNEAENDSGSQVDTALYVTASQLSKQRDFLLPDIRSLLVRGEVEGLFSIEEKHEINEVRSQNHARALVH